jgi:3-oxoacyl-[acyl-carrier protein] reductase
MLRPNLLWGPVGLPVNYVHRLSEDLRFLADHGMRETAAIIGVTKEEFRRQALDSVPIKRILDPREIADLVVYLASDAASGMIGQAINLDGGQVMS